MGSTSVILKEALRSAITSISTSTLCVWSVKCVGGCVCVCGVCGGCVCVCEGYLISLVGTEHTGKYVWWITTCTVHCTCSPV